MELKGCQILKKGILELQKSKRTPGYPPPKYVFLAFQTKEILMKFWKRGCVLTSDA